MRVGFMRIYLVITFLIIGLSASVSASELKVCWIPLLYESDLDNVTTWDQHAQRLYVQASIDADGKRLILEQSSNEMVGEMLGVYVGVSKLWDAHVYVGRSMQGDFAAGLNGLEYRFTPECRAVLDIQLAIRESSVLPGIGLTLDYPLFMGSKVFGVYKATRLPDCVVTYVCLGAGIVF